MSISTIAGAQSRKNNWDLFCEWVTSTNNRLYVGWFGISMSPRCSQQQSFCTAFVTHLDRYRWHPRTSVSFPHVGNNIISGAVVLNKRNWASSVRSQAGSCEWLYNGGPFGLLPLPHWRLCYMDANGNLTTTRYAPVDLRGIQRTCRCSYCCFPGISFGQEFF